MNNLTYTKLLNLTIEIYVKSGSLEAYKFITENADKVKGNRAQIYNFRYALASASGLTSEAMQIMKEAVIENGYWYSYDYLIEDDDLKPLHKFEEFHKLVSICKEKEQQVKQSTKPELKIIKESTNNENLLIALHGDQENIEIAEEYWSSLVNENYIVALPQSSQVQFTEGFVWDDVEKGTHEVKKHYDRLLENNNISTDKIIIGGFLAGARVALNSILTDKISVKGFVFVAPWLPEIDKWECMLDKLKEQGIKGYILCGDRDEDCFECTKEFVRLLEEKNISYVFKVIDDLDHDCPDNFENHLKEVIEYISN